MISMLVLICIPGCNPVPVGKPIPVFREDVPSLNIRALRCLETSVSDYALTQRQVLEDRNPQINS